MQARSILDSRAAGAAMIVVGMLVAAPALPAAAAGLVCHKVVAETATGEGSNAALGSRVKCPAGEMLTGGVCYPEVRPEPDGTCQTSAMGIIQPVVEHLQTTEESFFTCLQTAGTDCPVKERTRAQAVCCKIDDGSAEAKPAMK